MSDPTYGGVLLAKVWEPHKHDPTGYWMSEKLDGVRAYWNGDGLFSRAGKPFFAPDWFTRYLPKGVHLDGELFSGHGQFNQTVSAVRKKVPVDDEWCWISYVIFDVPSHPGVFAERMKAARFVVDETYKLWVDDPETNEFEYPLEVLAQTQCRSPQHLSEFHKAVTARGAEGTMLRVHKSMYERKRSSTLLKVKDFIDCEAVVLEHQPGTGKHKGRMGALICRYADCKERVCMTFKVGTGFSDQERDEAAQLFPEGAIITVRYQEKTPDGKPRFPAFVSVRDYE